MDAGSDAEGGPNPNPSPGPTVPAAPPNTPTSPPNIPTAPPNPPTGPTSPPGGGGGNSGDGNGGEPDGNGSPNSQNILARLGMLYLQLNEVLNNMSRTSSLIMKGVLLGSFIISALGLNKPSATLIRWVRHVLNGTLRLIGLKLGGSVESVVDVLIAIGEQYGLYYVVQWGVDSALCLENGDCSDNILLDNIQAMKIDVCGSEPYIREQNNHSYCHLAFNCIPFMILLVGVILLYILALFLGGSNSRLPSKPAHPGNPVTPTNPLPPQSISASCPNCKKDATLPYPNPTPVVCTNCAPKPPPIQGPLTSTWRPNPAQTPPPTARNGFRTQPHPSQDFHGCRLFTNLAISGLSPLDGADRVVNALSNISHRDALVSAIYHSTVSNLSRNGIGSGDDGDDDPAGCCELTQEELIFLRDTIRKYTQALCEHVSAMTCLVCHDNLHKEGLCSCPNCGFCHGQNNNSSGTS